MLSSSSKSEHAVFLSFRGEDTRQNFTSHLFAALGERQITSFVDEEMGRGDEISPTLSKAIQASKISLVIFSKDYASSKWCLNELVQILDCKKADAQIVIPIFYRVDPSDVRKQLGSFKDAFDTHVTQFEEQPEIVDKWRAALVEASHLSGWSHNDARSEAHLVDNIVKDVEQKLSNLPTSTYFGRLFGCLPRLFVYLSVMLLYLLISTYVLPSIVRLCITFNRRLFHDVIYKLAYV